MSKEDYIEDEEEIDLEEGAYGDEREHDEESFEKEYDRIFTDGDVDSDVDEYERDAVTGRRSKRPKMALLNKSKVSRHEMDDLFLD